ncbi:MAG: GtrA family protein [Daejeonella sp.]
MTWKGVKTVGNRKAFYTFAKAQVSAFIGGVSDYLLMIALTELAAIHYAGSIIISGILGAVINFSINKYWAFTSQNSDRTPIGKDLLRFAFVVAGSVLLKSAGTYLVSSVLNLDYRFSRLFVELIVSYGFNYLLLKYWVFKQTVH